VKLSCQYITGFIQGDGGVTISFRKEKTAKGIRKISYCFHIGQHISSLDLLVNLKTFFQCGRIQKISPTYYRYMVSDIESLVNKILPHFISYPLKDVKRKHFEIFSEVCNKIKNKQHLKHKGFVTIVKLAYNMNMEGKRRKFTMEEYLKLVMS
jgi:hypothetical protein